MSLSTEELFKAVKRVEGIFPLPAPFHVVDVGELDAASRAFRGLRTSRRTDREAEQHRPHQTPQNPPPRFQGSTRVTTIVDPRHRRTVVVEPAPRVPLAPVLLRFSVLNWIGGWVVRVNGTDHPVPAGQRNAEVNVWDAEACRWSVTAGRASVDDVVWIQRSTGRIDSTACGAFTIPVLPIAVVYSPPADPLDASTATYTQRQTIGSSVDLGLERATSTTVAIDGPPTIQSISAASGAFAGAAAGAEVLGDLDAAKTLRALGDQLGRVSVTSEHGLSTGTGSTMTTSQSTSEQVTASGSTGTGDTVQYYRNLRMIWLYVNARLQLYPLSWVKASTTVAGLQQHAAELELTEDQAAALLALDPFSSSVAELDPSRFSFVESREYAFGGEVRFAVSSTRETARRTSQTEFTTTSSSWEAGPFLQLFGLGGAESTTVTLTNATGTSSSTTVSMEARLVAGSDERHVVEVWYDRIFGTFAFLSLVPGAPRVQGQVPQADQDVTLTIDGRTFRTRTDHDGRYQFRSPSLPAGPGRVVIGDTRTSIRVGPPGTRAAVLGLEDEDVVADHGARRAPGSDDHAVRGLGQPGEPHSARLPADRDRLRDDRP